MGFARVDGAVLHYRHRGGAGRPVVLLNSLGTDLRIWDDVVAGLPGDLPLLLSDKRGHGLSPPAPASMEVYATDVAALMDRLGVKGALVCGVSIGGMIAQTLALARPDLVAGLLLSNTAARIGDAESWQARLEQLAAAGLSGIADGVVERWFSPGFRAAHPEAVEGYRTMLVQTAEEGYAAACRAIRDTDLRNQLPALDLPTLCLAGGDDLATPPNVVRDLADRIGGAELRVLGGVGHLPCIERPDAARAHLLNLLNLLGRLG